MLSRLFGRPKSGNRDVVDALYGEIVAGARQPLFYAEWGVPDTPLGRFEMLSLHVFLILHRLRQASPAGKALAQELTDEFFKDVDHSIRELGISDTGVPKRMKKLSRMFYGRVSSYDEALGLGDVERLAQALGRNVRPDIADWAGAEPLARHVAAVVSQLAAQPESAVLAGGAGLLRLAGSMASEAAA